MPQPTSYTRSQLRERARLRLGAQGLGRASDPPRWATAYDAVHAFGLMQAQEYGSAVRSVALRAAEVGDVHDLVRGYPMRGTVFLGTRQDMGWITQLCAKPDSVTYPKVLAEFDRPMARAEFKELAAKYYPDVPAYRVFKSLIEYREAVYTGAGQLLTPVELAGLDDVFGDDRLAAVVELATRYFRTHGPATFRDFVWWSKLSVRLVKQALPLLPEDIERTGPDGDDSTDYFAAGLEPVSRAVHLLPPYDEYVLGYQDRLFAMEQDVHQKLVPRNMGVFRKSVVVDGQVRGIWTPRGVEDLGIPKYALPAVSREFDRAHRGGAPRGGTRRGE